MARRFKKVDGGHGHHGGAWKVAYADFVTAMMALFMVLWLLASTDAASRKEISNYFRTGILPEGDLSMNHASQVQPAIIEQTSKPPPPDTESTLESKQDAAKQISDKLGKMAAIDGELAGVIKNVHIQVTPEGVMIDTVDEDKGLLFDLSSARLSSPMEKFLKTFAPLLARMDRPIEINGHTDARPFAGGSKRSNWDLSYERASSALQILEANGLPTGRVVGVFARGATQLYVKDDPYSAQNRRLSFLIKIPDAVAKTGDTKVKSEKVEDLNQSD